MNIITLNTWGGRAGKQKLLEFLTLHAKTTDVFCLQEIWSAPYNHLEGQSAGGRAINNDEIMVYGMQEISALLSGFRPFFRPHHADNYGLLMLVNKNLPVIEEGEVYVYKDKGFIPEGDVGNHARNIQFATIETPAGPVTVINFHGLWNGRGKGDSPDRLIQSEKIIGFVRGLSSPYVLCGDFNLLPDTESVKMLERFGMRNLIREHGITSTRTSYYKKPERYADYVFVSPELKVRSFEVLPDEVSDHSPLFAGVERM